MAIRVLVADDHRIMRQGLRALFAAMPDVEVAGEAVNGRDAVQLALRLRPDVVVMDVTMPDLNGIDAARQIAAAAPEVRVVGLSMHADHRFVAEMLRAGSAGYVLKDGAFEELQEALRTVAAGGSYLSPSLSRPAGRPPALPPAGAASAFSALTAREREVLQLLAEGRGTREIAGLLFVSVKTVETHRQHIMAKLGLRSLPELTKYAIREGLTTAGP